MKAVVSEKRYIKEGGNVCPFCEFDEVVGLSSVHVDCGTAWRVVSCAECGEEWEETYRLSEVNFIKKWEGAA